MRRVLRDAALGVTATVALLVFLAVVTARFGDAKLWPPASGAPATEVFVVSHGYHAGLALPTAQVAVIAGREGHGALIAVAQRFSSFPFVEIGWGDQGFYSEVPDAASITIAHALRALLLPGNSSVLHVVGLPDHPRKVFRTAEIVVLPLGEEGFMRMMRSLDKSFARKGEPPAPQVLGQGLYGPSLFYRAVENFHLFNVCNHWVARMLSAAGIPTAPVVATLPAGLLFDLKWRSGLAPMPREEKERI
jgi:uncharacterized protein (TIGR02117 family)